MSDTALMQDIELLGKGDAFAPFAGSTVLVTGSTGLIGSLFVQGLLAFNDSHEQPIRVLALARDRDKAARVFAASLGRRDFAVIVGDVTRIPAIDEPIQWISHGASVTSSAQFAAKPVEVALNEIEGTRGVLELAREKDVHGVVYLSSLEVYGDIEAGHGEVREDDAGPLSHLVPRNSYPAAKRLCETLCASYAAEYDVPVKIARLAQTFGAGVSPDDRRVFAYFARSVLAGDDIVLHTPGQGCRCYCYTTDAVEGIAAVLARGQAGQAYNVSNPSTYCSVIDMARMVARLREGDEVEVLFDCPDDIEKFGFAAPSFVKLNSDKLMELGWKPRFDLPEMYERLMESLEQQLR